jgi:hypothetical protein
VNVSEHLIPKKIHVSWKSKDILENQSPLVLNGLRSLVDMNPEWALTISDDADVESYLKSQLSELDYNLIRDRHIVEKSDLWRLLKVFNEGGLYTDIDRYFNVRLDDLISPGIKCVLPTYLEFDFSQDFMLSAPGNPIYLQAIRLNLQRRREGWKHIYLLGAQTYMHAVTQVLMGRMINTDPGVEVFQEIRQTLSTMPFIKTYRETPPFDTIVFRYHPESFKAGNGKDKRAFYEESGVQHWANFE